jgi:hypothetical protein
MYQKTKDFIHPNKECSCGIYSFNKREHVFGSYINPSRGINILAKLFLFGRVLRFKNGYRAQHARIASLEVIYFHPDSELEAMMKSVELSEAYEVECSSTFVEGYEDKLNDVETPRYSPMLTFGKLLGAYSIREQLEPDLRKMVVTELAKRLTQQISRKEKTAQSFQKRSDQLYAEAQKLKVLKASVLKDPKK